MAIFKSIKKDSVKKTWSKLLVDEKFSVFEMVSGMYALSSVLVIKENGYLYDYLIDKYQIEVCKFKCAVISKLHGIEDVRLSFTSFYFCTEADANEAAKTLTKIYYGDMKELKKLIGD